MEEENDELASIAVDESSDCFTETKYLLYGLDLEEQQYVFTKLFPTLKLIMYKAQTTVRALVNDFRAPAHLSN